jgi:2,6-dihydroxypseudooxynicotine hydrolase
MSDDSRIKAAVSHWAARMVSNGVPLADFQDVTNSIDSWNDWCKAWSERGRVHEELGRRAISEKRFISAGEHLTTAGVCYHFGKFLFVQDRDQMKEAHLAAVRCRLDALPYIDPPGIAVDVPWSEKILKGILRKPAGQPKPPVVIMTMGLDSAKEEMDSNELVFLKRGMATLTFDGPGQGECEYTMPICPEYEGPVGAVLDWIGMRDDLDNGNIGIWGVSLGGYYAPRAAAFHPDIKACISLSGPFDWGEILDSIPALTRSAFFARSMSRDEKELRRIADRMTLKDCASDIRCPINIVTGKLDEVVPSHHGKRLADRVSGPVYLNIIEDGGHVANNRGYKYRTQSADWMARQLGSEET